MEPETDRTSGDSQCRLAPNNYIAHDLRYGQQRHADRYTPAQKEAFIDRLEELARFEVDDADQLRDIFLGIYAAPVEYGKN
ncbi:hypothetical protein [uncultured Alistipes sp.]|uniref:hypothetical protein n=1 Tax=uncultured Alistipes sp. TaxID=538949 RepID=UPI002805DFCC|nr:hypothetical protein [uncultured Alistipes sp.]